MVKNLIKNDEGIVQGALYAIITIATIMTLIIALGPVMHLVMGLYSELEQEDTIFANSVSGWNSFMSIISQSELIWEMSMVFFAFIAIVYMIIRAIKKQSYTQYDQV